MVPTCLSIAGSDPSGGAGVQADLKTLLDFGVYGMAAVTALTVQNSRGVLAVHPVPPYIVGAQVRSLIEDMPPRAIKIGMIADAAGIDAILHALQGHAGPVVLDPVMVSTSGLALLDPAAQSHLLHALVPRATLLTPNLPEARRLLGDEAPAAWVDRTGVALLLKGGHGQGARVRDTLFLPGSASITLDKPRVLTRNSHGTGCTLSSAVAAGLALGHGLEAAVRSAVAYVALLLDHSRAHTLGSGPIGPLLHGRLREI